MQSILDFLNAHPLYPFIGFFVIFGLAIYHLATQYKKRREAFKKQALLLGFNFSESKDSLLDSVENHFELFKNLGGSKRIANVLEGQTSKANITVFDFHHSSQGETKVHCHDTVLILKSNNLNIPNFTLRPEHVFDKIKGSLGYTDINFESHPKFSKKFLLKSSNEAAIRKIFNSDVISFFEKNLNLIIEASNNTMLIYKFAPPMKPNKLPAFVDLGKKILYLFSS